MKRDIHWSYETLDFLKRGSVRPISKAFQRYLRRYCPPPAYVIDLTAGGLTLWDNMNWNSPPGQRYHLVFCDKKPQSDHVVKFDLMKEKDWNWWRGAAPSTWLESGVFDAAVIDSPYQFSPNQWLDRVRVSRSSIRGGNSGVPTTQKYQVHEVAWSFEEFVKVFKMVNEQLPHILKRGGILIVKIMTTHHNKVFYPNQSIIWALLSNMTQIDERIIQVQSSGGFAYAERAKKNHLRFMIFRNIPPTVHLSNIF